MSHILKPVVFSLREVKENSFAEFLFVRDGCFKDDFPHCFLSLRTAGSMRFRWNEQNDRRRQFFSSAGIDYGRVVPLELIHSQTVFSISQADETRGKQGDGLITVEPLLVPSVTVADCMPIYLYEPESGCFGLLHSGWKGTGIVGEALKSAYKVYGAKPENFSVVLGPHIQSCCYDIDEERASYFSRQFTVDCVVSRADDKDEKTKLYLSLAAANISLLKQAGIPAQNIAVCSDCTCCSSFLGSFRRETAHLDSSLPLEKRFEYFTPMAAFIAASSKTHNH